MENLIVTTYTKNELQEIIQQAIAEFEKKKNGDSDQNKNFCFAKAARILGRSTSTIQKMVKSGKLKTTSDGRRITQQGLQDYLNSER
jgi:CHASE1-domain containing sensor protein